MACSWASESSAKAASPGDLPHPGIEEISRGLRGRAWQGSRRMCHPLKTPPQSSHLCTGREDQAHSPTASRHRYPRQLVKGRDEEEPAAALRRCLLREAGCGEPRVEVGRPGACSTPDRIDERDDRVVVTEMMRWPKSLGSGWVWPWR